MAVSAISGGQADIVMDACCCRLRLLRITKTTRTASSADPSKTPTTMPAKAPALKDFVPLAADADSGISWLVPSVVSFALLLPVPENVPFNDGIARLPSLRLLARRHVRAALGAASVMGRSEATIGIHAVISGVTHQLAMYQVAVLGSPN